MRVPSHPPYRLSLLAFSLAVLSAPAYALDADASTPIALEADHVEGTDGETTQATGNVQLRQNDLQVDADWVRYNLRSSELEAGDQTRLQRGQDELRGGNLSYNLDTQSGRIEAPRYQMANGAARGEARLLEFERNTNYRLEDARFTTCAPNEDDWYLNADSIDLDYGRGVGEARHGVLEFHGVPIFYYPWLDFPLNDNRKSGFLAPRVGHSSKTGLQVSTPFYWNIAPNYDATLTPTSYAQRGLMLGGEFRYLQSQSRGMLQGETIDDRTSGERRYNVLFKHQHQLAQQWSLNLNVQKVSDDFYFSDFGDRLSVASQTHLPREATLNFQNDWLSASLLWQRYQTLQNAQDPILPPYERTPSLRVTSATLPIGPLETRIDSEITYFRHPTREQGERSWVYPTVSLPLRSAAGFVIPKLGWHSTRYQLETPQGQPTADYKRDLPIFSVDSGLYFDSKPGLWGDNVLQTLEPRAYYLYVPYRAQNQLPLFDTAESDLSFNRLFQENRFTGHDRINDANDLTLALNSRLLRRDTGDELVQFAVGQRIYFDNTRVGLTQEQQNGISRTSDTLVAGRVQLGAYSVGSQLQYSLQDGSTRRSSVELGFNPGEFRQLNLRYSVNRISEIEQVDLSGQWPIGRNWYAVGRYNYSLPDNKALEGLIGLEYRTGCWGLRMAAQRFITLDQRYQNAIFFTLELKGIGGVGINPLEILRQSIPNYQDPNRSDSLRIR